MCVVCVHVYACMHVSESLFETEGVCVRECGGGVGGGGECVFETEGIVCVGGWGLCVCVCVCERERERGCVCVWGGNS